MLGSSNNDYVIKNNDYVNEKIDQFKSLVCTSYLNT